MMGGLAGEKKQTAPHHPLPPASKKKYQGKPARKNKENTNRTQSAGPAYQEISKGSQHQHNNKPIFFNKGTVTENCLESF